MPFLTNSSGLGVGKFEVGEDGLLSKKIIDESKVISWPGGHFFAEGDAANWNRKEEQDQNNNDQAGYGKFAFHMKSYHRRPLLLPLIPSISYTKMFPGRARRKILYFIP